MTYPSPTQALPAADLGDPLEAFYTAAPTTTTAPPSPEAEAKPAPADPAPAPPAPRPPVYSTTDPGAFLACTRQLESGGNYAIVSADGLYHGAYQFLQSTWDATAGRAGRPDLIGVDPATASVADQDALAASLYATNGAQPWGGRCQ